MRDFVEAQWQRRGWFSVLLQPLAALYCFLARLRRQSVVRRGPVRLPVPVVVVGNLTVGGTGKTPLVAWIAALLTRAGHRPGVVIRGYQGTARDWPRRVRPWSDALEVGDEAVLLARRGCVVAAGPDRVAGARLLLEQCGCDVIVSDDGLQHYRLARDLEIVVIDGVRRFGNGRCLPAGPLREPLSRLAEVDLQVVQGAPQPGEWPMQLEPVEFVSMTDAHRRRQARDFTEPTLHAVAGTGYPPRFFATLRALGLEVRSHAFADHHPFTAADFAFVGTDAVVIMTEKDAVKCERFARDNFWFLRVDAALDDAFGRMILDRLGEKGGQEAS